ncbi:MAG: FAD:protein FMN transferase [Thermodesulfobacteriota bacterium]|nr:FAD:protein FMN transferase [Thermodesulfobacteriota bacterium]
MSEREHSRHTMDRRNFLKISGILGIGVASGGLLPISESVAFNRKLHKVTDAKMGMGTFVAMTALHPSKIQAEQVIGMAFEEMDRLTKLLDRYRSDSPIGALNKEGMLLDMPPEVAEVVARSLYFHELSHGAFDITVQPLVDLYKKDFAVLGRAPSEAELDKVLDLVDSRAMSFDGKSIRFKKESMGITLDGIAKGYIIDKAAEIIRAAGIQHALINAGGDIRAVGGKKDGTPWKVGIQNPDKEGPYVDMVKMANGAVATSGNYEVYFDKEKLFHHIVNPKTGVSPRQTSSVSVMASNVMDADALSTTAFVLEPEAAKRFIDGLPGTECLILRDQKNRVLSKGWPA